MPRAKAWGITFVHVSGVADTGHALFLFLFMKNFSFPRRARARVLVSACAAACASFAATSFAQTPNEPQLQPVVVTASRNPQQLTDTLPHTTVLQRADIERLQTADLVSLLQREAGVQLTQTGGRGTSSSLFLRGSSSLQTLVLLDGVPLTRQDATGSLGLEHVALDQIERIEIVRGNVSAIYGSGAIGGVIQLFSKRAAGAPSANLKAEVGSRGSKKLVAGVQGAFGSESATRLTAGVASERTSGFSALNTTQQPAANPDRDGYKNQSENFSISHDILKGHTLGLSVQRSDGRYDFDSSFGAPQDIQKGRNRQQSVGLSSDNRFTPDWLSRLSVSERSDKGLDTDNGAFGFTSAATTKVRQIQWGNTLAISKDTVLTLGLEQQRQSIDADDGSAPYQKSRSAQAVFAGLQSQWGAHQVQINLRNDKTQGIARETTGYLGYGFTISPEWKLSASTSTAFNVAPLGYLFYPFGGNPNLQPEKAKSAELGLQWSRPGQVLRATLFDTRSRNLFEYDLTTSSFANVASTRNRGIELSYSGKIAGADVRSSLTSQDPQDRISGQRLNRRAKTLAALSVDQSFGAWRLGGDLRLSGARRDGSKQLSSYDVMDVRVRYVIDPQLSLYGRIENLLNRNYQTVSAYNQAPRGLFVGVQWQPKF
jgi:vitamin B12 transporter